MRKIKYKNESMLLPRFGFFIGIMLFIIFQIPEFIKNGFQARTIIDNLPLFCVCAFACLCSFESMKPVRRNRMWHKNISRCGIKYQGRVIDTIQEKSTSPEYHTKTKLLVGYFDTEKNEFCTFVTPAINVIPTSFQNMTCDVYVSGSDRIADNFMNYETSSVIIDTLEIIMWIVGIVFVYKISNLFF